MQHVGAYSRPQKSLFFINHYHTQPNSHGSTQFTQLVRVIIIITWGEGSRVMQLGRVRLRRDGGGLVSNSMERGWLSRLVT